MLKRFFSFFLVAALLCLPCLAAPAPELEVDAKAAILYEASTDTILYEKNADEQLFPASTTKLLTALVAVKYGNAQDTVTVTQEAIDNLYERGSSSYLLPGEQISFMDLLQYMLIASGNDAANALAIHVGGSLSKFADMMNSTAQELGCTHSHFTNPNGLHDENHYTSARDLLLIAKEAMKDESIAKIVGETSVTLPITNKHSKTTTKYTTNLMLSKLSTAAYYYKGTIGIKTGSTTPAGLCLIGGCTKEDYTYYSVVLGAETEADGTDGRFDETIKLFDYGGDNFSKQVMLKSTDPITEIPVRLSGEKDSLVLTPEQDISALLPNSFETADLQLDYTTEEDVKAPVKAGDVLGTLTVTYNGEVRGKMNLVSSSDVSRSTLLYLLDCITSFFTSTAFKIVLAAVVALAAILGIYVVTVNRRRAKRRHNRSRSRNRYR